MILKKSKFSWFIQFFQLLTSVDYDEMSSNKLSTYKCGLNRITTIFSQISRNNDIRNWSFLENRYFTPPSLLLMATVNQSESFVQICPFITKQNFENLQNTYEKYWIITLQNMCMKLLDFLVNDNNDRIAYQYIYYDEERVLLAKILFLLIWTWWMTRE